MPKMSSILKSKKLSKDKHWVESALDEVLLAENKREYKKRTYFRPSSAHYCSRCLWYMMMGYPQPAEEPLGLRRLGIGTILESKPDVNNTRRNKSWNLTNGMLLT